MASSSNNSWIILIVLILIGAAVILSANEANHSYFKDGARLKNEGGKIIEDFVGSFTKKEARKETPPEKPAASTKPAASKKTKPSDDHKDELAGRDRRELGELLEKVGQ